MKISSLFNIRRRSPLGSRSSEWAQPSPRAFAILEFGKGFVIPVKAPFTQDVERAAKHMHFNGLHRARVVSCCAEQSARAPRSKFKIVKLLPLRAVTFPRAANRNVQNKRRNQNG